MTKNTSSYVNNLGQFDPSAKVIPITIKDEESLLVKDNKVYAFSIAGMQRRPVLRLIYPEKQTLKGVAARKLADTLRTSVPKNIKGSKTEGLCSKTDLDCVYYAPASLVFVFSSSRQLLELIELSETAKSSTSRMRRILGDVLYVNEKTIALYEAIDSSDRQQEARLLKDLDNDVDLSKLYSHSKLERHKQLYLKELRQDGSYASSNKAFRLSGAPADLNAVFNAREGNLQAFLNTIDSISSGSTPANISEYKSELIALIGGFNRTPDVVERRDRIRREKQEITRIAEQKAKRERLAAKQREQEARDERARKRARQLAERKERKENIGRQGSWVHAHKESTSDCLSISIIPLGCLWVTYKFKLTGKIVSVDETKNSYLVYIETQKLLIPGLVSFKYMQLKEKALNAGEGLVGSSYLVAFDAIEI